MFNCIYQVLSIDGDYVHLMQEGNEQAEPKLLARALLPFEVSEGSRVAYEMLQYRLLEE